MDSLTLIEPAAWAAHTFGRVQLGDRRRTRRVVALASCLLRRPNASLPEQMRTLSALKGVYRLLDGSALTHEALSTPHWEQTRLAAGQYPIVLLVQDTTEIDHTHHPRTTGLGPIGNGGGQGYLLQTVLAIVPASGPASKPTSRQVLGIAYQEPFVRTGAPKGQSCAQRRRRERESQVWSRAVTAIGGPPPDQNTGTRWVHVGDRYSDIFAFLQTCQHQHTDFLIRAAQDRRVLYTPIPSGPEAATPTPTPVAAKVAHLLTLARSQPCVDKRVIEVPAQHGRSARQAEVALSLLAAQLLSPQNSPPAPAIPIWVIRIWETTPPADGQEPLEWVLLTSVPTTSISQGWERRDWYCCRWLCEDYHQCLKTGCRVEARHLQSRERLVRLLGVLGVVAMRLLQLREQARLHPEQPAGTVVPTEVVQVVAALAHTASTTLTVGRFWEEVARQGGYLGRTHDGPPGWQTLWRGWLYIQSLLDGIHLARDRPRLICG